MVTCFGSLRCAATAAPPSPSHPGSPIPATVMMRPTLIAVVIASRWNSSIEISQNCVAHRGGADHTRAWTLNVPGPIAEIQCLHNRLLDRLRFLIELKGV